MKSDVNGCSTCPKGAENYESYTQRIRRKSIRMIQYDYRHTDGELFSTCAPSLETCRQRRNEWLKNNNKI